MIVTGDFDDWLQKDGVMARDALGVFEAVLKLPALDRISFKFVVDGEWTVSLSYRTTQDEFGNSNNYLDAAELTAVEEFVEEPQPESTSEQEDRAGRPDLADEKLTQVLTSDSSYAAVSIPASSGSGFPASSDSGFEQVHDPDIEAPGAWDKPSCRNAPEDITPTASRAGRPLDAEISTLGGHSCDSSLSGRPLQPESEAVALSSARTKGPGRREGLIVRLKGIFR